MKKWLTLFVLAAFVLGSMIHATETRVISMGEVNNVVKDDANIWLYPSTINYYPNIFVAEIGDGGGGPKADFDDMWMGGAHFGLGQDGDKPWVLGAYFSTEPYSHEIFAAKTETSADQRIHMVYGRNLADMPFGFILGYYKDGSKNEDTDETANFDQSLTRYELGFGLSPMEGNLDIGMGVAFTTWKDEAYDLGATPPAVVDDTKPSGNFDFGLDARYWWGPMGDYILVPHAGLALLKQGVEDYDNGILQTTVKTSETIIDLGVGLNYEADEDVLVVGDVGFMIDKFKTETEPEGGTATEDTDNDFILPYFKLGIDAYVTRWLDFRAGVVNEWLRNTVEPLADQKQVTSNAFTRTYLGAGVHWGDFAIDAIIAPEFITNGPYFISGEDTDGEFSGLAAQASILYNFD